MLKIPLSQDKDQSFNITLAEQNCFMRVYEAGDGAMYMDLSVQDRTVVTGARCVYGIFVLLYRQMLFKGNFLFVTIDKKDPQSKDFGINTKLFYVEDDD